MESKNTINKYYLSSDGYYFIYKQDRYDPTVMRAKLFKFGNTDPIADLRVTDGYGKLEKLHHDVINHFESRITLGDFR